LQILNNLPSSGREDLIRRAWYSHDARWYTLVAREFGFDVANSLNREAVRAVGRTEARRLAGAMGIPRAESLSDFLAFMDAGCDLYVAPPLIEMDVQQTSEREYTIHLTRCFVAENITKAGIAADYECAVFDRVQGWHDALGLPLESDLPPARCPRTKGATCQRTLTLKEKSL